jgi:tRNA threonylcarbamoyladenosine biosynthesis protein TsaE
MPGPVPAPVTVTHSAEETRAAGAALGRQLAPGDVVAFIGDLGTGKTCMIQGICAALEVTDYVSSPTFILINEYAGRCRGQAIPVYHFDLYRVNSESELENLGSDEYFSEQSICLVEWAERAGGLLPPRRREVRIEHLGADARRITLTALTPPQPSHP